MTSRIKDDLGEELPSQDFVLATLQQEHGSREDKVEVKGYELVASYSWVNEKKFPTIMVPGAPMVWKQKPLPMSIPQDSGKVLVNHNTAMFPENPLEPLIRAVQLVHPDFDFPSIDIVTDRHNMVRLFNWIVKNSHLSDFRIDAQLAGNTMLLTRWDEKAEEFLFGFSGYGHEFEKANAQNSPGLGKSSGYHRIAKYNFGDLKMLVRYQVDGSLRLKQDKNYIGKSNPSGPDSENFGKDTGTGSSHDSFTVVVKRKEKKPPRQDPIPFAEGSSRLHYLQMGVFVDRDQILEMKTCPVQKPFEWAATWSQLYFSQTPTLMLGRYIGGQFVTVEQHQLNKKPLTTHAQESQPAVATLHQVLSKMKSLLVEHRDKIGGLSFVCQDGELGVYFKNDQSGMFKMDPCPFQGSRKPTPI